jgi:hypothetical protein
LRNRPECADHEAATHRRIFTVVLCNSACLQDEQRPSLAAVVNTVPEVTIAAEARNPNRRRRIYFVAVADAAAIAGTALALSTLAKVYERSGS